ncbi:MAG: flagellar biosynthesis anti-sigma factor FlgM [Epsilonproteobacteria bacterium]|nr:flagellar biosynthesis anti-sigma factor FlgM [Campylobacterota bacterium]
MKVTNLGINNQLQQTSTQQNKKVEKQNISRVEELKKAIEEGTYKVDIKSTAKAMAKNLL